MRCDRNWAAHRIISGIFSFRPVLPEICSGKRKMLGEIIAMLIFFALGIRLIIKAIRNERIEERLENNLGIKRFVQMTARTGIYTILVGIAFGFLGTNTVLLLIMMIVFTIAFVIGGMYTGYHMGFDSKTMVYAVGQFYCGFLDLMYYCAEC